jgi:glyoxylase-like metal-dependent hydrolase (beta-lactamase superfamily II)
MKSYLLRIVILSGLIISQISAAFPSLSAQDNYLEKLCEHLYVYHGNINVGILINNGKVLLIDFGDGKIESALPELNLNDTDLVLFTHHHRDQACGLKQSPDMRIGIPAAEAPWFENVEDYWMDQKYRWHIYTFHPHRLMLTESIRATKYFLEGDTIKWGPALITVLETPGHTDGSVSYIVDVDRQRFIFSGDLIYDKGKISELYSMQRGGDTIGDNGYILLDYHAFMGSRKQVISSLSKILEKSPDMLIPSHGNIMHNPVKAVNTLIRRLDKCYKSYAAVTSVKYYYGPGVLGEYANLKNKLPYRGEKSSLPFIRRIGTTSIIIAENKDAFVIDCGYQNVIDAIKKMQSEGEINNVTGLWVTHYHDDHVDAIPEFVRIFGCPVYADINVAKIISNPEAYYLPCISPAATVVTNITESGDSWKWNEFIMTAFHFPGQTLYHGALLVDGRGVKMLFTGDSFTPSGIDDYCSGNRNLLGKGLGYDYCITLLQNLKPTYLFNQHLGNPWIFDNKQLRFIKKNLARRVKLFAKLFPWDSPNYGTDEHWVRCYPYQQRAERGSNINIRMDVTNHSSKLKNLICYPEVPITWNLSIASESIQIPSQTDGSLSFTFKIPEGIVPGFYVIPFSIDYDNWHLAQFKEFLVEIF